MGAIKIEDSNKYNSSTYAIINLAQGVTSTKLLSNIPYRKTSFGVTVSYTYENDGPLAAVKSWTALEGSGATFPNNNPVIKMSYDEDNNAFTFTGLISNMSNFIIHSVEYYIFDSSVDDILSHLADINWPYPTGTVHYYDTSLIDLKTQLHNTPRYAGSELEEGKKCVTNAQYSSPSFTTEHITSNGLVWNSTYVDTTKNNSYWIHKTSGYIDVYLVFYANVTPSSTWTIATINSDIINYGASYDTSYYGFIGNDNYGSFSSVYLVRSGSDGDAGNLQIRGIGMVKKGKNTSGITSSYATYATIRIIPNSWNSAANYELRSTYLRETIEDV